MVIRTELTRRSGWSRVGLTLTVNAAAIDTRWCGDITYIHTWEGSKPAWSTPP